MNGEPLVCFVVRIYVIYISYGAEGKKKKKKLFSCFSYIGRGDRNLGGK